MSSSPFELLGLEKSATEKDIKIAFRKKALIYHPDKGGDADIFRKIFDAYHILIDPFKRSEEISKNPKSSPAHPKNVSKEEKVPEPKIIFNEREKNIIDYVVKDGSNIFLHGPGGTGKTTLINEITKRLKKDFKKVAITATTGIASINIGGTTLHRFAGIGLGQLDAMKLYQKIYKSKMYRDRWIETDVLVVDEVSMLGGELLEKLNFIAQNIRKNKKPFGGIQLIFSGDLLQLPPIKDKWVFEADCWDSFKLRTITLTESKRFTNDTFFKMLLRFREGNFTEKDVEDLQKRRDAYEEVKKNIKKMEIKPSILYSKKIDVEGFNIYELKKIKGQEYEFEAIDDYISLTDLNDQKKAFYKNLLDEAIPENITLKVGAQVMLRKNIDIKAQLVNGSRGVVTEINEDEGCVVVKFKNGITTPIYQEMWEFDDEEVLAIRQQIPLILAWSITIHKSQGATLDSVVVDLGESVFSNAQAYVALSRVRNLDDLYISDLRENSIHCDQKALAYTFLMAENEKKREEKSKKIITKEELFEEED